MNPRRWLNVVGIGVLLVVVAMIVSLLTLLDKEHFGFLVGPSFLMVITSGVFVGAVLVLIGAIAMPQRKTWRGIVLIVWALIAVTSPLFGFLFLLPWTVMTVMLPVVIVALIGLRRELAVRDR